MDAASPTVCASCVWLHGEAKREGWYRWLCMQAPAPARFNPVTGLTTADPPYHLCRNLNDGNCPSYEEGVNCLNPKETTNV